MQSKEEFEILGFFILMTALVGNYLVDYEVSFGASAFLCLRRAKQSNLRPCLVTIFP